MSTARIRRSAIVLASLLVSAVPAVAAEPLPPPLIQDTPLVLKDGRMAYVTVRAVPFERGADMLSPGVAEGVAAAAAEIATDCFLTAQAIGHVEPGAQGEGDMLASHRLARARAERVQEALSLHGIPASAIASVWDWQFLVREPRVTLWVFRMRRGEDCQGKPLPGNTSLPLLAKAETPAPPPAAPEQPPQALPHPSPHRHRSRWRPYPWLPSRPRHRRRQKRHPPPGRRRSPQRHPPTRPRPPCACRVRSPSSRSRPGRHPPSWRTHRPQGHRRHRRPCRSRHCRHRWPPRSPIPRR